MQVKKLNNVVSLVFIKEIYFKLKKRFVYEKYMQ